MHKNTLWYRCMRVTLYLPKSKINACGQNSRYYTRVLAQCFSTILAAVLKFYWPPAERLAVTHGTPRFHRTLVENHWIRVQCPLNACGHFGSRRSFTMMTMYYICYHSQRGNAVSGEKLLHFQQQLVLVGHGIVAVNVRNFADVSDQIIKKIIISRQSSRRRQRTSTYGRWCLWPATFHVTNMSVTKKH